MEQIEPESSVVLTLSVPDDFDGQISNLQVVLASQLPLTGMPDAILATIENSDSDGDGERDVDQILNSSRNLVLALEDVGVSGDYHVMAILYMEGGGQFQPVPGVDFMASSETLTLGQGKADEDNLMWPIGFFAEYGLFAMHETHVRRVDPDE